MPSFGRRDHHRTLLLPARARPLPRLPPPPAYDSIAWRSRLSRSSSAAMRPASIGSLFQQEIGAEIGATDPSAGIDARPEQEPQMEWFRRPVEPCRVHQRGQTGILPPAHRQQALRNKGAIESVQRHDIRRWCRAPRDRARQADRARPSSPTKKPRLRNSRLTATSVMNTRPTAARWFRPRKVVEPVRVHQRQYVGQLRIALMVVDDHDIGPSFFASVSGSTEVVPQSTVTNSVAPRPASPRTASTLGP